MQYWEMAFNLLLGFRIFFMLFGNQSKLSFKRSVTTNQVRACFRKQRSRNQAQSDTIKSMKIKLADSRSEYRFRL